MQRERFLVSGLAASSLAAAALGFTAIASAQSSTPAGPWITPNQHVSLKGFESYEQLTNKRCTSIWNSGIIQGSSGDMAVIA